MTSYFCCGCPRGVMVKNDRLRNRSKRVRTPVALLCSLSDKYTWESYEPPYCRSSRTTIVLLEGWLWNKITYNG